VLRDDEEVEADIEDQVVLSDGDIVRKGATIKCVLRIPTSRFEPCILISSNVKDRTRTILCLLHSLH
jgi:hypothetical protein